MATGSGANKVDETKWPKDHVKHVFDKHIKDKKQDSYDVAAEINEVFKDIAIQFDLEDYEDLLNDAKKNLPPELFVSTKEFDQMVCEWVMMFKEEVSSTLLSECLDIIDIKFKESQEDLQAELAKIAGDSKTEFPVDKFPEFIKAIMPILEVRLVNLTTKKPKSDENVLDEKEEKEFYSQVVENAKKDKHTNINLKTAENILIDYFKSLDAQYCFVSVETFEDEQGLDPFNDLGEHNPFAARKKMEDQKDDQDIAQTDREIVEAEREGNTQKAKLLKNLKQMYVMKKNMESQQERDGVELMIDSKREEIRKLDASRPSSRDNEHLDPYGGRGSPMKSSQPPSPSPYGEDDMGYDNFNQNMRYSDSENYAYAEPRDPRDPTPAMEHNQYHQESSRGPSKLNQNRGQSHMTSQDEEEPEKRLEDEPMETLDERRKRGIKEIFDFYTRQHIMVGKKATFEQIEYEMSNMNMGEFMKFCKDFKIPVSKTRCAEVFKKTAKNSKEMFLEHFDESFVKLIEMRNKEEKEGLEKRLREVKKLIGKRKKKLEIDDSPDSEPENEERPVSKKESLPKTPPKTEEDDTKVPAPEDYISKRSSITVKPKGGDPHGAVQQMENQKLEEMKREAEEKKKNAMKVTFPYFLIFIETHSPSSPGSK